MIPNASNSKNGQAHGLSTAVCYLPTCRRCEYPIRDGKCACQKINTEAQDLASKLLDALKYETDVIDLDTIEQKIDEIFFPDNKRIIMNEERNEWNSPSGSLVEWLTDQKQLSFADFLSAESGSANEKRHLARSEAMREVLAFVEENAEDRHVAKPTQKGNENQ